jgi:MinD-like ATPase involved in chromosome partitioning or flagellar assembly
MTILFREVLDRVAGVLRRHDPPGEQELTVVVDVQGRVRVLLPKGASPGALPALLAEAIGPWLAEPDAIVASKELPAAVLAYTVAHRAPWPLTTGTRWFLLDRVVARHGWVGDLAWAPPWSLAEADAGRAPPIWVFFSHKGGVGRTTAVAAVGSLLARRGMRVLAVDLDLEAPGLGDRLLSDGPGATTVLDLLVGVDADLDERTREAVRGVTDPALVGAGALTVVPAGEVDEAYLRMLARLDLQGSADAAAARDRIGRVLRAARDEAKPDVILLDARAGFHDVGGLLLAGLAHGVVFLGRCEAATWQGLRAVARALAPHRDPDGGPAVMLQVVHAHAPAAASAEHQRFEDEAFRALADAGYYDAEDRQDHGREPLPVRFDAGLRAADGLITAEQLALLDTLHAHLALRIAGLFPGTKRLVREELL